MTQAHSLGIKLNHNFAHASQPSREKTIVTQAFHCENQGAHARNQHDAAGPPSWWPLQWQWNNTRALEDAHHPQHVSQRVLEGTAVSHRDRNGFSHGAIEVDGVATTLKPRVLDHLHR